MQTCFCIDLKQIVQVVARDRLLELGEDLLRVGAVRLHEFLLLVFRLDVGLAFVPERKIGELKIEPETRYLR